MDLVGKAELVTGGCFCGAIRYEAEAYIHDAYYCHCQTCQKISGVPAEVGVIVKPGGLRLTKGEPKYYQTSHFAERGFCPDCGSRLFYRTTLEDAPDEWLNLPVGTLDHPENAVPTLHMCVESQLPWFNIDDGLPRTRTEDDTELTALWAGQDNQSP